ncbi:hypothetical protein SNB71_00210, partial [Escherichia coli]|nr:hypothetical protein [Escherichia coli]MDZ9648904.1 hypothetical protein [Escherichia coli]MDZ9882383.1 hypothetical protein [Escherichia coli]
GTADRNRSHWSTSKTPSYTKSVSWQHHLGTVSDIIGVRIDSKYIMAIIIWLYFLSGGYIQWFVLSKRIINK